MKRFSLWIPASLVFSVLPWAPSTGQTGTADKPRTVQDDAGLFSKEAKDRANAQIARIKSNFKKDLVIETVKTIPIPDNVNKEDAVNAWAAKRHESLTEGIYLALIVDPQRYRVYVSPGAGKLFSTANRKELEKILVGHLKNNELDPAVTDVADYVFEMMRRNGLLARGLQVLDVKTGTGPSAKRGDTLTIQYIGRLKDGKTFDKTLEPTTFILKEGVFIKGFEQGIVGMRPGGVRKLVVPPDLAYGKEGVGDIPPAAELHFEIELLKIR